MDWPRCVLLMMVLVAAPTAAQVVTDAEGDVRVAAYDNAAPSGYPWTAVDLRAITIEEDDASFRWTVQVTALAEDRGGNCADSGDLRSFFRYGEAVYNVQQGLDLQCQPYGFLYETFGTDFDRRFISALNASATDDAVTVVIPKQVILDDGGTPPIAGRSFEDIRARSFNMFSLGGPDPNDPFGPQADMLVIADDMPDGADTDPALGGVYLIQQGGMDRQGPVRIWSEDPFRASNGGAALYTYEVSLHNEDVAPATFAIDLVGIPGNWRFAAPASMTLGGGEQVTLLVAVETPFGHQHGGSDVFHVRATRTDGTGWARADLGIHYLDVPQPAGHHPDLYLHAVPLGDPFTTTFAGGDGLFTMNTLPDPPQDADGGPIQGFYDGNAGNRIYWYSCLQDGLRLGIDMDLERTGTFRAHLETTRPYPGATLNGRLLHLGTGPAMQFCAAPFFGDRVVTELGHLEPATLGDWQGSLDVETSLTPLVDRMPFARGSTLVLELWVEHGAINGAAQSTATIAPGAVMHLPLNEYVDAGPAGLIGGGEDAPELAGDLADAFDPAPNEPARGAPVAAWLAVVALIGAGLAQRR